MRPIEFVMNSEDDEELETKHRSKGPVKSALEALDLRERSELIDEGGVGEFAGKAWHLARMRGGKWEYKQLWRQRIMRPAKTQVCVHERDGKKMAGFKPFAKDVKVGDKVCQEGFLGLPHGKDCQAKTVINIREVQ